MTETKLTKAEKTRVKIVEAAAELFNKKGYSATSVNDIMKATGLSKGGLYSHFEKGKEEIAVVAFRHAVDVVYKALGTRTKVIDNTLDKLKAVVYYYRENIFSPPVQGGCPIQNTSVEADENNEALKIEVVKALKGWQERLVHTLNKGIERGEIKPDIDIEDFAIFFIGGLEGGILLARAHRSAKYFDVMAKSVLEKIERVRL